MKVTGYMLQNTLRELQHTRDMAASQFDGSLKAFDGEEDKDPRAVMAAYLDAEARIATIQTAQARYNLEVVVPVVGFKVMSLSEAVKRVGGAGRAEKMWRSAAVSKKDDYSYHKDSRSKDEEYAKNTITPQEALDLAKKAAKFASALREAIQVGNSKELEIEGLDPALFTE